MKKEFLIQAFKSNGQAHFNYHIYCDGGELVNTLRGLRKDFESKTFVITFRIDDLKEDLPEKKNEIEVSGELDEFLKLRIKDIVQVRLYNLLSIYCGIYKKEFRNVTVGDLPKIGIDDDKLLMIRNCGQKSLWQYQTLAEIANGTRKPSDWSVKRKQPA